MQQFSISRKRSIKSYFQVTTRNKLFIFNRGLFTILNLFNRLKSILFKSIENYSNNETIMKTIIFCNVFVLVLYINITLYRSCDIQTYIFKNKNHSNKIYIHFSFSDLFCIMSYNEKNKSVNEKRTKSASFLSPNSNLITTTRFLHYSNLRSTKNASQTNIFTNITNNQNSSQKLKQQANLPSSLEYNNDKVFQGSLLKNWLMQPENENFSSNNINIQQFLNKLLALGVLKYENEFENATNKKFEPKSNYVWGKQLFGNF